MSPDRAAVRQIDWLEVFPWLGLARTIGVACGPSKLLMAVLGMTLTSAGWLGISRAYEHYWVDDPVVRRQVAAYERSDPWRATSAGDLWALAQADAVGRGAAASASVGQWWAELFSWYTRPFWQMFAPDSHWAAFSMAALCALWTLAVWAFCGGTIGRLAALRLAQDRRLGLMQACRYAIGKWFSYFSGPLVPLGGVALLVVLPALIAGWISRADVGFAVVGPLWPIGMVFALMCAVMLVAALFGWPLMWAAVSADASDSFDGFNRSFSYVTQRPFHLAFYAAVAALIGSAAWLFVAAIGELTIYLMDWGVSWGSGTLRAEEIFAASGLTSATAGGLIDSTGGHWVAFWSRLVRLIVLAFGHSFLWTSVTGIYLLLRRDTDGTPLDEVYLDSAEDPHGPPPVKQASSGTTAPGDTTRPQPARAATP